MLSYITKSWVSNYLKMRQFERFYSALGRFQFSAFSASVHIFSLKLNTVLNFNGINIASCAKNILGRHVNQSGGSAFLKNPTKNTNSATLQASSLQDLTLSADVYPNLVNLDNSLFPYTDITVTSFNELHTQTLNTLTHSILRNVLLTNTSLYSVLTNLTTLNTHRINDQKSQN